jgi:hypothetical protein
MPHESLPVHDPLSLATFRKLANVHAPTLADDAAWDAEWTRGRDAGLAGRRLTGAESGTFIAGHARGLLLARGGR